MIPRLYIREPLGTGFLIPLRENQLHYLRHVLRLTPGQTIHLFNGRDGEWQAEIHVYNKKEGTLKCLELLKEQREEPKLVLMCALIKPQRMEFLMEKATELGVTSIIPLLTDHCTIRKINIERLEHHCTEAAEQCERLSVPTLNSISSLREALPLIKDEILWADESRDQPATFLDVVQDKKITTILIGPEGGFSEAEKEFLRGRPNVNPVHLGKLILRAETAGIAMISALQAHSGAWR